MLPSATNGSSGRSEARGTTVDFYTAVPAGHGEGRGLPVCLVLHGASATAAEFDDFGFGRFLTDAVQRGAKPFVLAGATGGRAALAVQREGRPRAMVHDELPGWCEERGFDTRRMALWGWSMGGYGALHIAETYPGFARAVAAFSPACSPGDTVFQEAGKLKGTPVGLWCGLQDSLVDTGDGPGAGPPRAEGGRDLRRWSPHPPLLEPLHARRLRLSGRRTPPLGLTRRHPTFASR